MQINSSTLDVALSYVNQGWYVIPLHSIVKGNCSCGRNCRTPGKHPRISKWQAKASIDADQICRWWEKWPDSNIGISTGKKSGLVVIDIDPRNGGDESLKRLIDSYSDFKPVLKTYTVATGGSGQHYYFDYDKAFKSYKKHGLGAGIDIKADGGYVVAPPSSHQSGGYYSIDKKSSVLELPQILIDLIQAQETKPASPVIIAEGNRNNWLTEQASQFLRDGKPKSKLETFLLEQNILRCFPPLDTDEVLQIVKSISKGFNQKNSQMSFKTQWQKSVIESGLGSSFCHVSLCLSLWMNCEGREAFPSEEAIAERCQLSRKTVIKALHVAEEQGYLKRYRRGTKGKRGFHYGYVAIIPGNQDV